MTWVKLYEQAPATTDHEEILFGGDARCCKKPEIERAIRQALFRPREWNFSGVSPEITAYPDAYEALRTLRESKSVEERRIFSQENKRYLIACNGVLCEVYVPLYGREGGLGCVNLHFDQKKSKDELWEIGRALQGECSDLAWQLAEARRKQMGGAFEVLSCLDEHKFATHETRSVLERALHGEWYPDLVSLDQICRELDGQGKRVKCGRRDLDVSSPRRQGPELVWAKVVSHEALLEGLRNAVGEISGVSGETPAVEYGLVDGMPLAHLTVLAKVRLPEMCARTLIKRREEIDSALDAREFLPPIVDWRDDPYNELAQLKIVAGLSCGFLEVIELAHDDGLRVGVRLYLPRGTQPSPPIDAIPVRFDEGIKQFVVDRSSSSGSGSRGDVEPAEKDNPEESSGESRNSSKRMTVAEANNKAMKLARKLRAAFFELSERQQAEMIGCSWATWHKTDFFQQAQGKRRLRESRQPSSPETVSLTDGREAATGEGCKDEVLEELIAQQQADHEPSPLEPDQEGRPRKIHFRKRL
jgi:hypothetical protein